MNKEVNGTPEKHSTKNSQLFPLLIGQGKLARHLHHYFHLTEFPHKHFDNARDLAQPEFHRKIREVNSVWVLTTDQSIASVMENIKVEMIKLDLNPANYTWIHSSAATEIAGTITFHPLMTFGPELYSLEQYQAIPFALISNEEVNFPLSNKTFKIESQQRSFYHACAVMMSNLPILLWSLTSTEAKQKLALDPQIFHPILKQTLDNFLKNGESALTGPIARNDQKTIAQNLAAISNTPLLTIYEAFL